VPLPLFYPFDSRTLNAVRSPPTTFPPLVVNAPIVRKTVMRDWRLACKTTFRFKIWLGTFLLVAVTIAEAGFVFSRAVWGNQGPVLILVLMYVSLSIFLAVMLPDDFNVSI
jgi:hypothetical protein